MLNGLLSGPYPFGEMGAIRFDGNRDKSLYAVFVSFLFPDAFVGVRVGEEGPPQQRDSQDDESDSDCINHGIS
ncbi:hypothetical protein SYK_20380 [Pseudodesulfovibrio nedwellii]|uniref:Uncharacterized protein n=1 Tax=Pseudodesulfovibrio nedwellii TaxID=2973072 RepID=A0ABM8B1T8_9BACT|nr:hypothetical protein SYK_20380 [Pseudodesulfovibrio nedwellii]